MANMTQYLVIDVEKTIGDKLLLLGVRKYKEYKEGVKGEPIGLTFTCLSETMNYEKVDIKVAGLMQFEFDGTPVPVAFDGLNGKIWQDWGNKGEVKLSITASSIRPLSEKRIKIGGDKA